MSLFRQALSCVLFWIGTLMAFSPTAAADDAPAAWKPFSHVSFRHHMEEALSFGTSITQDHEGFIWLGTQTGLVRWDGFRARRYRADPEQEGSLPDAYILSVHVDTGGRLWVGTSAGGLVRYREICQEVVARGYEGFALS